MNKKISTLVAALFLGGMCSVNAAVGDKVTQNDLISGKAYFVANAANNVLSISGGALSVATASTAVDQTTQDAQWIVSTVKDAAGKVTGYTLKNVGTGEYLAYDGTNFVPAKEVEGTGKYARFTFVGAGGDEAVYGDANDEALKANDAAATPLNVGGAFGVATLYEIPGAGMKAADMNAVMGKSFNLVFKKAADLKDDLTVQANPFTAGPIVAVAANADGSDMFFRVSGDFTGFTAAAATEKEIKAFRASTFITVSNVKASTRNGVDYYTFTTVKGSDLVDANGNFAGDAAVAGLTQIALANLDATDNKDIKGILANAIFNVAKDVTYSNGRLEISIAGAGAFVPGAAPTKDEHALVNYARDAKQEYVIVYNNLDNSKYTYYVSTGERAELAETFLTFGFEGKVTFANMTKGYVTIKVANQAKDNKARGKVLGVTVKQGEATLEAAVLDVNNVNVNKPEGQWIVTATGNDLNGNLTFVNRESNTTKWDNVSLYKVKGETNLYAVSVNALEYNDSPADTLLIEPVALPAGMQFDGYANWKAEDLRDTLYNIAVAPKVEGVGNLYLSENHNNKHLIGLVVDQEQATPWRIYPQVEEAEVVYVINEVPGIKDNAYKADLRKDTLAIVAYKFQNDGNREYLRKSPLEGDQASYECDDSKQAAGAGWFILKEKNDAGTLFNVLPISAPAEDADYNTLGTTKLYGAITVENGRVKDQAMYKYTDNDLFTVTAVPSPEYRKVAAAWGDTIKIYRNESADQAQVLYEKGEFLNVDNVYQFKDINPSIFVDTAYVNRGNNNRWQYLLAVNVDPKSFDQECNIPGHPAVHTDTVYGRFLVNLIDTANIYGETHIHNNPYIDESEAGESFAKLSFVQGYHTNDSLYLVRKNGELVGLDLSTPDFNVAKFAFRYVDPETGSFKIQTQYKPYLPGKTEAIAEGTHNNGYLKWINGTVVVVHDFELGDVFNMNEDEHRNPTENGAINASEVAVIAGAGSVTIQNAAGKTVAISNILGKTIANTVISSDNATISVPAGIVVVSVEGEDTVKAIVK